MRLSIFHVFLWTCCVCVTLSEIVVSEDGLQRTRNFPMKRFINALGWQTRKLLKMPGANQQVEGKSPYWNPGADDDLQGAFSYHPHVAHAWGGPPILNPGHSNHPPFQYTPGPLHQNGWGPVPVGVHIIPVPIKAHHPHQKYHHVDDYIKNGWSKGPEQPHHYPHIPKFKNRWSTGAQQPQQYYHHHGFVNLLPVQGSHLQGWGWKPMDPCMDVSNRTISTEADLPRGWRIMRVVNATARELVEARVVLNPPLKHIPEPPLQLTANSIEEAEKTYYEEISIDFDEDARNSGYSVTRNVFSTTNGTTTSSRGSSLPFDKEGRDVLRGAVAILKLKKPATPLRGKFDRRNYFEQGLTKAKQARERGETTPPVKRFFRKDLLYATELFERILDFEGDDRDEGVFGENDNDYPLEENWMEMPTVVGVVEKRSLPDIDHSERTILDLEFNFGLPTSSFEFQRVGTTMEQWRDKRNLRYRRKLMHKAHEVSDSFGGFGGFLESSEDFVRSRMKLHRTFLSESFIAAEERVQTDYVIAQFLICPTLEGDCGKCPLDPILAPPSLSDWKSGAGGGMRMRPDRLNRVQG